MKYRSNKLIVTASIQHRNMWIIRPRRSTHFIVINADERVIRQIYPVTEWIQEPVLVQRQREQTYEWGLNKRRVA